MFVFYSGASSNLTDLVSGWMREGNLATEIFYKLATLLTSYSGFIA
jgi:hypothetical protein